jgi:long-chain acyl-CoA synthetase
VTALLTLRRPLVEAWARERGIGSEYAELRSHPELRAELQRGVDAANALLSRTEQVRRFEVLENGLSVEAEELTPTLKIRREVVAERYRERLDALYLLPER